MDGWVLMRQQASSGRPRGVRPEGPPARARPGKRCGDLPAHASVAPHAQGRTVLGRDKRSGPPRAQSRTATGISPGGWPLSHVKVPESFAELRPTQWESQGIPGPVRRGAGRQTTRTAPARREPGHQPATAGRCGPAAAALRRPPCSMNSVVLVPAAPSGAADCRGDLGFQRTTRKPGRTSVCGSDRSRPGHAVSSSSSCAYAPARTRHPFHVST